MKVLLKQNVSKLGTIGEVVDVSSGYARNYLIPKSLAVQPTEANLKAVEAEKQKYLEQLASEKADLQARAEAVHGREISLYARANEQGHLYGSVGPAQICEALAAEGISVEPDHIVLDSPIRQLDKYDVALRFAEDVQATINVWVLREHGPEGEQGEAQEAAQDEAGPGEESS